MVVHGSIDHGLWLQRNVLKTIKKSVYTVNTVAANSWWGSAEVGNITYTSTAAGIITHRVASSGLF